MPSKSLRARLASFLFVIPEGNLRLHLLRLPVPRRHPGTNRRTPVFVFRSYHQAPLDQHSRPANPNHRLTGSSRHPGSPLQQTRPRDDLHLRLHPDPPRVQPRRLPRIPGHDRRAPLPAQPRRPRQPHPQLVRRQVRSDRPRRPHAWRLRRRSLDHSARRLLLRHRRRSLPHPRLETPRKQHACHPLTGTPPLNDALRAQIRRETEY